MAASIRAAQSVEAYSRVGSYSFKPSSKPGTAIRDVVEFSTEAIEKLNELSSQQKADQLSENQKSKPDPILEESLNILNLGRSASKDEIRKAYLYAIKQYHPDKYSTFPPEFVKLAEEKTKEISQSYKNLMSIFT